MWVKEGQERELDSVLLTHSNVEKLEFYYCEKFSYV